MNGLAVLRHAEIDEKCRAGNVGHGTIRPAEDVTISIGGEFLAGTKDIGHDKF